MYKADSKEKLDSTAKAGGVLIVPPTGGIAVDALVASCDGCGAKVWLDPALKDTLDENEKTNRTFCLSCLQTRKVL